MPIDALKGAARTSIRCRPIAETPSASTLRYYEANAATYAATTLAMDTSARLSRFVSLLPAGGRILDAGCGAGRDLRQFRLAGLQALGLDLSPSLAEIARQRSGCEVVVGNLLAPPALLPFDGVWAMASLLHVERHLIGDALASLSSLMKQGAFLFCSVKKGAGETTDVMGRFFTLYEEAQWAAHLRQAGFEILEMTDEPPSENSAVGSVAPGWIASVARLP